MSESMSDTQNAYLKFVKRRVVTLNGPDNLKVNNDADYRKLVGWIEDRVIRQLKVEERDELKKTTGPIGKWKPVYQRYLESLYASYSVIDSFKTNNWRQICLQFLLNEAIIQMYEDNQENQMDTSLSPVNFDNIDPNSADFKKGVAMLADFLQISVPKNLTPAQIFQACVSLLESRFENRTIPEKGFKVESLEKITAGFDTGDKILNNIGRILRLLHLQNFRSFQNLINQTIVAVQELTANPKTDQRLGQVGRG